MSGGELARRIMACLPYYAKGSVVKGFGRGSKELGIPTGKIWLILEQCFEI